ncbi:glycosyl transferase family 90-domain-containing protein [Roridomyces roridus]|uniref:Glycosyl transferase family 90-domain-containing protein n=1 Tax=Roridomyces roridus TaxID=1738132 RepID=A0AAD7C5L4_9AGAR|nr:glycosyl transferase family 90-domain-containing protein [Roridomyces roridus]
MASWPFKTRGTTPANGDSHPLLPTNGDGFGDEDDDREIEREMSRFATEERRRPGWLRRNWPYVTGGALVFFLFLAFVRGRRDDGDAPISRPLEPYRGHIRANYSVQSLLSRQSTTLEQAKSRYALRNNRSPPPNYDEWYKFARDRSCLIDEYEQISRDFAPFYQLAQDNPAYFRKMVASASSKVKKDGVGMKTGKFRNKEFSFTDDQGTLYTGDWPRTFERFAYFMPDMDIILNGRDEPRVVFNIRVPNTREKALDLSDPTPFEHSPRPTDKYFRDEMKCLIPMRPKGFTGLANDASAFMLSSSSTEFTHDLYPLLSMTKISPCFSDILVPSEFYYSDSYWNPRYPFPNNVIWSDKISKLYWRGKTSGGWIYDDNYHSFPRFRLMDIARSQGKLMNVKFSEFHDGLCTEHCNADKVKAEYHIVGDSSPREEVYNYKYLFDVDGNSFSGRYHGLLKSGSLVFKSTVFEEYFNDWLRPFVHYIPILPDLSDLVEKLEWAVQHDNEAHAIQETGQLFAERVLTDAQNDCYFSLVLLEWARLQALVHEVPAGGDTSANE